MLLWQTVRTWAAVGSIRARMAVGRWLMPAPAAALLHAKGLGLIALHWQGLAEAAAPQGQAWAARAARAAAQALPALAAAGQAEGALVDALRRLAARP